MRATTLNVIKLVITCVKRYKWLMELVFVYLITLGVIKGCFNELLRNHVEVELASNGKRSALKVNFRNHIEAILAMENSMLYR